jgi:hypothetical protein
MTEQQIAWMEIEVEAEIANVIEDAEGRVDDPIGIGRVGTDVEDGPLTIPSAKEERRGMSGVADGELACGRVERCDDGGRELAGARELSERAVHFDEELSLIDLVHESAHAVAKFSSDFRDGMSVPGDVCDAESSDTPGAARADEVDVPAGFGILVGDRVDPSIEASHADVRIDGFVSAPDFEAAHLMC